MSALGLGRTLNRLFGLFLRVNRQAARLSLSAVVGAIRRRWRLAFLLLVVVGLAALVMRRETESEPSFAAPSGVALLSDSEVALSAGNDATGTVEGELVTVEIDPRQLARQRAEEQRYKQGLSILIGLGVVAVVWFGLSRYAAKV